MVCCCVRLYLWRLKSNETENLITNIFSFNESEIENHVSDYDTENGNFDGTYAEAAQAYVMDSGGLSEFDFEV